MSSDTLKDASIAVAHGNYLARGGGERVAEEIARTFDAPLYYGFGSDEHVPDDIESYSVCNDSALSRFSGSKLVRDSYYFWHFDNLDQLSEYDIVIQSGNEFGWYTPPDEQVVVRYLHSTPRTPYDRFHDKADSAKEKLYSKAARIIYQHTVPYPDYYVPNSELIQRRLERYFGRSERVEVVHPPVDTTTIPVGTDADRESGLYLTWSRLYPAKCIEEIVDGFRDHPDKRLIIGGTGPERDRLEDIAPSNVDFRGYLKTDELHDLLQRAEAGIFAARNEDFGLVPVEMMAAGCPVIGVRDGYTKYQIKDGKNGVLYNRGSGNLAAAIERMNREGVEASHREIAAHAQQYDTAEFSHQLREVVLRACEHARIDVDQSITTSEPVVESPAMADGGMRYE